MNHLILTFAQAYGAGAYGSSTYQNGVSTSGGGLLTNTGFDLLLAATIASALICLALIVRFWRRSAKKASLES